MITKSNNKSVYFLHGLSRERSVSKSEETDMLAVVYTFFIKVSCIIIVIHSVVAAGCGMDFIDTFIWLIMLGHGFFICSHCISLWHYDSVVARYK